MLTTPRKYLSYDPARDIETDIFNPLTGSVSIASNLLRVNTDTLITFETFLSGIMVANVAVPTAPTITNDRKIGFNGGATGAYAHFFIDGADLMCQIRDEAGVSSEVEISWSDGVIEDWTNIATNFEIRWEAGSVRFLINGVQRAQLTEGVPRGFLSGYLHNAVADDMDVAYLTINGF